ncbi:MAG TPA: glycerol-3-phosphate dehydrogenase [Exiguobacterium sp.]|nr:glycerol-3-phosphate dehydrogenase [Exiguobacterium sp.]
MFSSTERTAWLEEMGQELLDVLVIGGGITGAGILLDAQSRGMRTGLIEMQDFAEGTSSRSTKLVHGGLRYLKQFEIKLVAEVGKERAIVYENAPHVTTPEWMMLPLVEGGTFGSFSTSIGLRVYDQLAGVKRHERRTMLSKEETLRYEPLLRSEHFIGGGRYVEYKTDDARLTVEVLKAAIGYGGRAVNYTKAESLVYHNGKVVGVEVRDVLSGKTYTIRAKKIINATGPWVDELREKDGSKSGKSLHLTKGIHLVIDQVHFPLQQAVYFDVPDGRMIFAIPREGKTYVGTTDTNYKGDILEPGVTVEDQDYILEATNQMFNVELRPEHVESTWSGLRPLIHEDGKDPSELSRKDEIFVSKSGLMSIAGGKLTGYRKMAERIIDMVAEQFKTEENRIYLASRTHDILLGGGHPQGSKGFARYMKEQQPLGEALGLSPNETTWLIQRYGTNVERVFELIRTRGDEAARYQLPLHWFGALLYGLEAELVMQPGDFLNRRASAVFFDFPHAEQYADGVLALMRSELGWSAEDEAKANESIRREFDAVRVKGPVPLS